jgi:prepilin-type N-terminal cleavage/methylation domain-containing protein/prepilin-type processing-associated H-X9-DG protein
MRRNGFSLVELVVVIAVIGMLLALVFPAVMAARSAAREAQCRHNLHEIGVFVAQYTDGKGRMPALTTDLAFTLICPDVRELVDANWKAAYQQRYNGCTRDFAMNDTALPSVAIPIAYDRRLVHHDAVNALFLDGHVAHYVEPPKALPPSEEDEEAGE